MKLKHDSKQLLPKKLLRRYEQHLQARGYRPRGIVEKLRAVRFFLEYLEDRQLLPADIDVKQATGYREHLATLTCLGKNRYTPATVNVQLAHLRHFYTYLINQGKVLLNPFDSIEKMKEVKKILKTVLTVKQMGRLLAAIKPETFMDFKFKVCVEVLYATGMRISELEQLTKQDINLQQGWVRVRDTKGGHNRRMPLTECARQLLAGYLPLVKGKIFMNSCARATNSWINKRLKELCKSLRLPIITCHGIRHTLATQLFKAGAGIREVQEFLGHKRIKNTETYTRLLVEDLKKIVDRSHPREKRI